MARYKPPMGMDADCRDILLAQWHARCKHAHVTRHGASFHVCATHRADLPCPAAESLLPLIREVREDERHRLHAQRARSEDVEIGT